MTSEHLSSAFALLWREVYQGVEPGANSTWFVQGSEALLPSLNELTAERASARIGNHPATIGAHVWHTWYYLETFNGWARGDSPVDDWPGSWTHQEFTPVEWDELRARFKTGYEEATGYFGADREWKAQETTAALACLAHAAYHLGAIRAMMHLV